MPMHPQYTHLAASINRNVARKPRDPNKVAALREAAAKHQRRGGYNKVPDTSKYYELEMIKEAL